MAHESNASNSHAPDAVSGGEEQRETIVSMLLGECLCATSFQETSELDRSTEHFTAFCSSSTRSFQFIDLHGVECISLGSITSELTPMKRVTETVRRLITNNEAPVSIGYISGVGDRDDEDDDDDDDQEKGSTTLNTYDAIDGIFVKDTVSIPLDIYSQTIGVDFSQSLSPDLVCVIDSLKSKRFDMALQKLQEILMRQQGGEDHDDDDLDDHDDGDGDDAAFLFGITLHNIAVVSTLAGQYQESIEIFQSAVDAKKTSFGDDHRLVAESLNELGILYFAQERFNEALAAFEETKEIQIKRLGSDHPKVALTMNNIACIYFLFDQPNPALTMFKEGKDILRRAMGSSTMVVKLDLLHVATVSCNLGYMEARLKNYEGARAIFEEAQLVQQSVLDESHDTLKDTRSNIEFTNAFHF